MADPAGALEVEYRGLVAPTSVDERVGTSRGIALLGDGTLYSLDNDGRLVAYSADGVYLGSIPLPLPENFGRYFSLTSFGPGAGRLAVAVEGGPVCLLDGEGAVERRIGADLDPPLRARAVAAQGDLIYVLDDGLQAVRILDLEGRETGRVGAGRIRRGTGLAVGADGRIAVTDPLTYRVLSFEPDGRPAVEFGTPGGADGKFSIITGIAVDSAGRFWVIDLTKRAIQVFDSTGAFLKIVPVPAPCAIAVAEGRLYVASASLPGIVVFEVS